MGLQYHPPRAMAKLADWVTPMDFTSSVPLMADPPGYWWILVPPSPLSALGHFLEPTHISLQGGCQLPARLGL